MAATLSPFANGLGAAIGSADALWRGGHRWQVFLYPKTISALSYIVEAKGPEEAIQAAWARLKADRKEA